MANTYSNTDWSADSLTKATATSSTVDNVTLGGTLTVTGATQLNSTLTVGVDATGYDVKFFGDTTSKYWLWDESADGVVLVGTSTQTGNSTITGNLTVSGTLTLGSGAELAEAELEMLDGITAGTAAASKALVLDSNKDIGTIRNLTIDGTFSDGNYTFDTSGNVTGLGNVTMTGDLTVSGGDITLGTTSIFSGGNTASLNNIDAIDATTEATIEAALDTLPNVSSIGGTAGSLTLSKEVSGSYVYMNILNSSSDDDSDAFYAATTYSDAGDPYIALIHSVEDDPDERWSLGADGSTDIFKLSYRATNALLTPSTGSSYEMFTVSKTGNTTIAGTLVAKTYKPETFFAYNNAGVSALTSGTEYYMAVNGNPLDTSIIVLQEEPLSNLIETALCDFTIQRIAVNIYGAEDNVTSVEVRLKKYDGSGDMDDKAQWGTVGTVATIHNSSTLNADTRVVQTPSDWVVEKNEIWGLTVEYTISSGTITHVQINGGVLMLQDWSDIIANT